LDSWRVMLNGTLSTWNRSAAGPAISTIVVAHDRRRYLRDALTSLLRQTLPRREHEILVVKNFAESELDAWCESQSIRTLLEPDSRMGAKVATALGSCRGPVVCLLEDDDLFEPGKLERVAELFSGSPATGFFHHGFTTVSPDGAPVEVPRIWQKRMPGTGTREVTIQVRGRDLAAVRAAWRYHPDFNNSSIAIRRDVVTAQRDRLRKIDLVVDSFLFYCALSSGTDLAVSREPLSRVRVHSESVSGHQSDGSAEQVSRLAEYSSRNLASQLEIDAMLKGSGRPELAREGDGLITAERGILSVRSPALDRRQRLDAFRSMVQLRDTYALRSRRELPAIVGLSLVSRSLSTWWYRSFKRLGF
ncbi:MAG: glycosyltransferase family A protein, partial [Candidatus Lutacidiplasmatales archaeon]